MRRLPKIGARCHELRIHDADATWRIIHHIAPDAIVILELFAKKTAATPKTVIETQEKTQGI